MADLRRFIDERCVVRRKAVVSGVDLVIAFDRWRRDYRLTPKEASWADLVSLLREGYRCKEGGQTKASSCFWYGITLKDKPTYVGPGDKYGERQWLSAQQPNRRR